MEITRKINSKSKKHIFFYKNRKISNKKTLDRIHSLKIPPAYRNVKISNNPNSKVQAIGTDSKKRKQYLYNKKHTEKQTKLKFSDLVYFGKKIKKIRKDINKNIKKCHSNKKLVSDKDCIISIVLYLIDKCNFRVGCDKYKTLYNSYGATTLNSSHFKFDKNKTTIEFVGKKGVTNKTSIKNPVMCNLLQFICVKNKGEFVFYYNNNNDKIKITEKHINNYLKKYHKSLSVKMFRTWSANHILLKELLKLDIPNTPEEAKKNVNMSIKKASINMHHSASVSKNSYMNNEIIDLYTQPNSNKFVRLIEFFRKTNGELPDITRLLNLILKQIN